ncbi:MAG: GNAT family N-acetyltransferase, partial [Bryobacteraceae bacterium]
RLAFASLASVIFSVPFKAASAIYEATAIWDGAMRGYVGYLRDEAVSIVATVAAGGVIGVYSLGTLPQHQGCGYAETLMRFALDEGKRESGIEATVLQATRAGLSLYKKMGYRVVTHFSVYMHSGCG